MSKFSDWLDDIYYNTAIFPMIYCIIGAIAILGMIALRIFGVEGFQK